MNSLVPKIRQQTLRSLSACSRLYGTAPSSSHSHSAETSESASRHSYSDATEHTHFGFRDIPKDEKVNKVNEVFSNVASKYDLMNDAMSGGIHRLWKDYFIHTIGPSDQQRLLDVAGGTGDITFRFLDALSESPPKEKVTVFDLNQNMLDMGQQRAERDELYSENTEWVCGNAEKLPFDDSQFDLYTIAFGIRNCTNIDLVLKEAHRVLRPGGRFFCLEFSRVDQLILRKIYDEYSFQVIPVMGHLLASDWNSYQYLVESIRKFPSQEDFKGMIEEAGFKFTSYENLTAGVCAIHSGYKI